MTIAPKTARVAPSRSVAVGCWPSIAKITSLISRNNSATSSGVACRCPFTTGTVLAVFLPWKLGEAVVLAVFDQGLISSGG